MDRKRIVRTASNTLPPNSRAEVIESFDGAALRILDFGGSGERGTTLIIPGWAEPSEKYGEVAADLLDRGFRAVCYDPRGQGLSQRLDDDDPRGRIDDFDKPVRDLAAVVDHLDAERLVLLGHSMGGLTALSHLAAGGRADAAVLSAPASRIFPAFWQRLGVMLVTSFLIRIGLGDMALSREGGQAMTFEGNTLTSDPERHAILRDLLLAEPDLKLPRATPAMVAALHRQQAAIHRRDALSGITVPVKIVSVPGDKWVDSSDHLRLARQAGHRIECVEVPGARHEILMERDEYRDQFWDAFDAHVDAYLPPLSVLTEST